MVIEHSLAFLRDRFGGHTCTYFLASSITNILLVYVLRFQLSHVLVCAFISHYLVAVTVLSSVCSISHYFVVVTAFISIFLLLILL